MHQSEVPHETGIDLLQWIRRLPAAVRRRKWTLVGCIGLALTLGAGYLLYCQPLYRVGARVLVRQQPLTADSEPVKDRDFLATQAEIVHSPAVISRAIERHGLISPDPEVDLRVAIYNALNVSPLLGTDVLSIAYSGPDAAEAIRTVEAVIGSYREYVREIARASHRETLNLLTRREQDLRSDLAEAEAEYRKLRESIPVMGQGREAATVQRAMLIKLGETLTVARSRRLTLEQQLAAVQEQQAGQQPVPLAARSQALI